MAMKRAPSTTDRPPHISVSRTYFWVRGLYQGLLTVQWWGSLGVGGV